jgi:hypothetical protein
MLCALIQKPVVLVTRWHWLNASGKSQQQYGHRNPDHRASLLSSV